MNRIPFFRFAAIALLLVASGRQARADFIYALSVSPGTGVYTATPTPTNPTPSGSVALTLETPPTTATPGSSSGTTVNVASIKALSGNPSSTNPDTFNVNYHLTLTLTDQTSGMSPAAAPFQFNGTLTGTAFAQGANVTNTFSSPTTQTTALNGHTYSVTIQPTQMTWQGQGTKSPEIQAVITEDGSSSGGGGPPVSPTPEPSALLLAGLAVPALGLLRRRKATVTV